MEIFTAGNATLLVAGNPPFYIQGKVRKYSRKIQNIWILVMEGYSQVDWPSEIVIKTHIGAEHRALFQTEVDAYQKLHDLQGVYIPRLLGMAYQGGTAFLILEYISLPFRVLQPSDLAVPEVVSALYELGKMIGLHGVGLDAGLQNFLLDKFSGRIMAINFDCSNLSEPDPLLNSLDIKCMLEKY